MAEEIIKELKTITETRTCDLNVSDDCAKTGPLHLFKWARVCSQCDVTRARNYAKNYNKNKKKGRPIVRAPYLPRKRKQKAKPCKSNTLNLHADYCNSISATISFD